VHVAGADAEAVQDVIGACSAPGCGKGGGHSQREVWGHGGCKRSVWWVKLAAAWWAQVAAVVGGSDWPWWQLVGVNGGSDGG